MQRDLPSERHEISEPIKPVATRWNSYYSCFEHAVKLQAAVTAYANFHIERVKNKDVFARSRNNQIAVVTEYMGILKPLKGV